MFTNICIASLHMFSPQLCGKERKDTLVLFLENPLTNGAVIRAMSPGRENSARQHSNSGGLFWRSRRRKDTNGGKRTTHPNTAPPCRKFFTTEWASYG